MSNVIYVDILLMINLLVNFLMLSAAGLLVKTPTRSWRILLSAAIGAIYLFCGDAFHRVLYTLG